MFKVGDRVICSGIQDDLNIDGKIGIIYIVGGNEAIFQIKFDEKFSDRLHGVDKRCWNVNIERIQHYNDKRLENLMLD